MKVRIGYGDFRGYLVAEVPGGFLRELAARFPLKTADYDPSDAELLYIVLAVHEELNRRASGEEATKRVPSVKELAAQIVNRGFRNLSTEHHPDRGGDPEAQRRLTEAKELLLPLAEELNIEHPDDCIMVPSPCQTPRRWSKSDDDDVPF